MPITSFRPQGSVAEFNLTTVFSGGGNIFDAAINDSSLIFGSSRGVVRLKNNVLDQFDVFTSQEALNVSSSNGNFIAAVDAAGLYYSTDDGETWNLGQGGFDGQYTAAGNGVVIGGPGNSDAWYFSIDDGVNWAPMTIPGNPLNATSNGGGQRCKFIQSAGIFFVQGASGFYHSTDGVNWSSESPVISGFPQTIEFFNGLYFLGTSNGNLYSSGSLGGPWTLLETPINENTYTTASSQSVEMIAVHNNSLIVGCATPNFGTFYRSIDGVTFGQMGANVGAYSAGGSNITRCQVGITFDGVFYTMNRTNIMRTLVEE